MRVSCSQEQLQRALSRVGRAVSTRTTLPVLSNILLSTDDNRLRIAATDLDIGVTTWIDADIESEGKITVDSRLMSEFVNSLPAGAVALTTDDDRHSLTVQSGRAKASINGIEALDFPHIPSVSDGGESFEIPAQKLKFAISMVEFSAATDESRPVLAGVMTRIDQKNLVLASADGFRMAVIEEPLEEDISDPGTMIVPARSYRELARLIGDLDEPVTMATTSGRTQLLASIGDTEWVSRLIDGTFPDVAQITPKDFQTKIDLSRESLLGAVRRAGYFARENNDVVFLTVQPGDDELAPGSVEVSANAAERGNSQSFVDANITGPEVRVAFNSRYLIEVLSALRIGQVMIGLNGSNTGGLIRASGTENCKHVIMPMVIGG